MLYYEIRPHCLYVQPPEVVRRGEYTHGEAAIEVKSMLEHLYLYTVPDYVKQYAIQDKEDDESLSDYISRLIILEHKKMITQHKESRH